MLVALCLVRRHFVCFLHSISAHSVYYDGVRVPVSRIWLVTARLPGPAGFPPREAELRCHRRWQRPLWQQGPSPFPNADPRKDRLLWLYAEVTNMGTLTHDPGTRAQPPADRSCRSPLTQRPATALRDSLVIGGAAGRPGIPRYDLFPFNSRDLLWPSLLSLCFRGPANPAPRARLRPGSRCYWKHEPARRPYA